MGEKCSCMYYEQESNDLLLPVRKRIIHHEPNCLLISLETQVLFQTLARSFLLRKKLLPLLTNFKLSTLNATKKKLPYPDFNENINIRASDLVLSIEKSLEKLNLEHNSQYEFHLAIVLPNGSIYEGHWDMANIRRCGTGIEIFVDGSKYIGNYSEDLKDGYGRMI